MDPPREVVAENRISLDTGACRTDRISRAVVKLDPVKLNHGGGRLQNDQSKLASGQGGRDTSVRKKPNSIDHSIMPLHEGRGSEVTRKWPLPQILPYGSVAPQAELVLCQKADIPRCRSKSSPQAPVSAQASLPRFSAASSGPITFNLPNWPRRRPPRTGPRA